MKISILGCGRWGSFLAWYLDRKGHEVVLWGRTNSNNLKILKEKRRNNYVNLSADVLLTNSLETALNHSNYVIIAISAQSLRDLMEEIINYSHKSKTYILCMKGLEEGTGKRLSEVVKDYVEDYSSVAIWVGPGHAQDFVRGIPNCMIIDSEDTSLTKKLTELFGSDLIRFYYGNDMVGNEIGAAAKNVMGIAAGMLDGLEYPSLKGPLMARGAREISRLVKEMGGNEMTIYGLCHLGDYEATLFSEHSNNRKFGEHLVQGKAFGKLAEGVSTVKAIVRLAEIYKVDVPISKAVYAVVIDKKNPKDVFTKLFMRSIKSEIY